jgi:hypothetical protein
MQSVKIKILATVSNYFHLPEKLSIPAHYTCDTNPSLPQSAGLERLHSVRAKRVASKLTRISKSGDCICESAVDEAGEVQRIAGETSIHPPSD